MSILEKLSLITTFVFDMDGVLTTGSLGILPQGEYTRVMDIKDGYAIQYAIKQGYNVWVITGSSSAACKQRLSYLGITEYYDLAKDKAATITMLIAKYQVDLSQVLYMGDDVPDIAAMLMVGCPTCPANAAADVIIQAKYISPYNGGQGCVRDVIEKVMKLQGKWQAQADVAST